MSFIRIPVKGMPDYLPKEMLLREYVLNKIKASYGKYGFLLVETPAVEHIENLTNKQGGENEQLIFKILKRGKKLSDVKDTAELCDCGLRYDLTVPLARFYANNSNDLPLPFKSMQIGSVWRADKPQKGRFRQFTQCDIDIIGDHTILAEIELIVATTNMLYELNLGKSTIRINDRRILRSMALYCGFPEDEMCEVFIILDKYDKIGIDGICRELLKRGYHQESINKYSDLLNVNKYAGLCKEYFDHFNASVVPDGIMENIDNISNCVKKVIGDRGKIVFDPTLVRGMSYYTSTIFEIELPNYKLSVAGGGRYDDMIGKYSGNNAAACGFSIGFERIVDIIKENSENEFSSTNKTAYLISKDVSYAKVGEVLSNAQQMREAGTHVMVTTKNKNVRAQKEKLESIGYNVFIDVFDDTEI